MLIRFSQDRIQIIFIKIKCFKLEKYMPLRFYVVFIHCFRYLNSGNFAIKEYFNK